MMNIRERLFWEMLPPEAQWEDVYREGHAAMEAKLGRPLSAEDDEVPPPGWKPKDRNAEYKSGRGYQLVAPGSSGKILTSHLFEGD